MPNLATTEIVVLGWLRGLNLASVSGVSTQLPTDYNSWANGTFIVVEAVSGGQINPYTLQKQPVVQISFNAVAVKAGGSGLSPKPPYKQAVDTGEEVIRATRTFSQYWREEIPLILPDGYEPAWIEEIVPRSDVRRRAGDNGNYAVYDLDLQFYWSSAVLTN